MDAVGAEHVRELVRVGDDRSRSERQHQARELVGKELRRLEVHVRVDEPRDDPAARRVEDRASVVLAEPGDEPVGDRDVDLEPFLREDGEDASPADDEVGGLVPTRHRETALQSFHRGERNALRAVV